MSAKAKKNDLASSPCPMYVICGKERRRVIDAMNDLIDRLLGDADPQLALSTYDGASAEIADVLDELRTLPFLSSFRIVVIKDADPFITRYRQNLEEYLDRPSETGVLLLIADSFPKTTRLAKRTIKDDALISCDPIKPKQLPAYLKDYAREQYGLQLSTETAQMLVDLGGDESGLLMAEIDKLAAFVADPANPRTQITIDDIHKLIGHNRQFNVFNVIDAMTGGDTPQALQQLHQMMTQDREAQYTAVGAFAWHIRRLYRARLMMDQRAGDRAIISEVRIWSNPQGFLKQVRQLSLPHIAHLLRRLMTIDLNSKTGGETAHQGLERLIIEFSGVRLNSA